MKGLLDRVKEWDWYKISVIAGLVSLFMYMDDYFEDRIERIEEKIDEIPGEIDRRNMLKNIIVEQLKKEDNVEEKE